MSAVHSQPAGALALQLVQQLQRSPDTIPPFNHALMKACTERINTLYQQNFNDIRSMHGDNDASAASVVQARHITINFVRRCCLAYIHERAKRIKKLRWKFGSNIPSSIKGNLSEAEIAFHSDYCRLLADYQCSLSEEGGVDLMSLPHPPQTLFVQVRALTDYGEFETSDGIVVVLKRNSIHSLPVGDCEPLIRNGVLTRI